MKAEESLHYGEGGGMEVVITRNILEMKIIFAISIESLHILSAKYTQSETKVGIRYFLQ
jgi:hypothetical protein